MEIRCQTADARQRYFSFFRIGGHDGRTGPLEGLKFYWLLLPLFHTRIRHSSCDVACLLVSFPVGCLIGWHDVRTGFSNIMGMAIVPRAIRLAFAQTWNGTTPIVVYLVIINVKSNNMTTFGFRNLYSASINNV